MNDQIQALLDELERRVDELETRITVLECEQPAPVTLEAERSGYLAGLLGGLGNG